MEEDLVVMILVLSGSCMVLLLVLLAWSSSVSEDD
jgi:hypothetical protein